jgi:hypothetical protein
MDADPLPASALMEELVEEQCGQCRRRSTAACTAYHARSGNHREVASPLVLKKKGMKKRWR